MTQVLNWIAIETDDNIIFKNENMFLIKFTLEFELFNYLFSSHNDDHHHQNHPTFRSSFFSTSESQMSQHQKNP